MKYNLPAVLSLCLALSGGTSAQADSTWTTSLAGSWSTGSNWSGGVAPSPGASATPSTTIINYYTAGSSPTATFTSSLDAGSVDASNGFNLNVLNLYSASNTGQRVTIFNTQGDFNFGYKLNFNGTSGNAINFQAGSNTGYTILAPIAFTNGLTISSYAFNVTSDVISGLISGTGGLTITSGNGPQTGLSISNASNSYSGGLFINGGARLNATGKASGTGTTTLNNGSILLGTDTALGTASQTVILNGGILTYTGLSLGSTRTLANAIQIGGNVQLEFGSTIQSGSILALTGTVDLLGGIRTLTVNDITPVNSATDNTNLSGIISNGGITKAGPGRLIFSGTGSNTYTGQTTVNSGELYLSKTSSAIAVAGNLTVGDGTGGASADVVKLIGSNQIATSSTVVIASSGLLDLNAQTNTVASLSSTGGSIASSTAGGNLTSTTGPAFSSTGNTIGAGATVTSGTTATLAAGGSLAINGTLADSLVMGSGSTLTGSGTVSGATGVTSGTINGTGLVLSGLTTFNGTGNVLSGTETATAGVVITGTAAVTQSGTLTGSVNHTSSGTSTFSGTIAGGGSTVNVNNAAGTLILSGANSYGGGTTVTNGKLQVSNTSGSATGSGTLTVGSGGTLAGNGKINNTTNTINGNVQVGSGGTNTSDVLTLTSSGTTSFSNASLTFNLSTSGISGGQGVSNQLALGSTSNVLFATSSLTLNLVGAAIVPDTTEYILFTSATGGSGIGGSIFGGDLVLGAGNVITGLNFTINSSQPAGYYANSYLKLVSNGGSGFNIDVEVVPEPGTWALLLAGLLFLVASQRARLFKTR